ncbi:MAG: hypothetical protein Q8914_00260 [Bacteroidota bacterium]|nr:hypothetical protein [Bacteroidota bacterium]
MKKLLFLLLLMVGWSFGKLNSQTEQKLLFALEPYSWQIQFGKTNGLQRAYIFYQDQFVNADGVSFSKEKMESIVNSLMPDTAEHGFAIINWEGSIYNTLAGRGSTSETVYQQYLNQFIAALRYAKKLRPNMQWSYYFMPTWIYSQYAEEKGTNQKRCLPLLKELDFLAPEFYPRYEAGLTVDQMFVSHYMTANLWFALALGSMLNKPVYCFVWHRYCSSDNPAFTNGNMLIDYPTYKQIIAKLLTIEYFNNKASGLIWWNDEDYLCNRRSSNAILAAEYQGVTDLLAHKKYVLQTYLDTTLAVMDSINNLDK